MDGGVGVGEIKKEKKVKWWKGLNNSCQKSEWRVSYPIQRWGIKLLLWSCTQSIWNQLFIPHNALHSVVPRFLYSWASTNPDKTPQDHPLQNIPGIKSSHLLGKTKDWVAQFHPLFSVNNKYTNGGQSTNWFYRIMRWGSSQSVWSCHISSIICKTGSGAMRTTARNVWKLQHSLQHTVGPQ